jgi:hypothetical protein
MPFAIFQESKVGNVVTYAKTADIIYNTQKEAEEVQARFPHAFKEVVKPTTQLTVGNYAPCPGGLMYKPERSQLNQEHIIIEQGDLLMTFTHSTESKK